MTTGHLIYGALRWVAAGVAVGLLWTALERLYGAPGLGWRLRCAVWRLRCRWAARCYARAQDRVFRFYWPAPHHRTPRWQRRYNRAKAALDAARARWDNLTMEGP